MQSEPAGRPCERWLLRFFLRSAMFENDRNRARCCWNSRELRECVGERPVRDFTRVTVDPAQMGGVPCVRHLRIPVATVLRLLAGGLTEGEILSEYPDLEPEDIRECLRFAAVSAMERELPLIHSA